MSRYLVFTRLGVNPTYLQLSSSNICRASNVCLNYLSGCDCWGCGIFPSFPRGVEGPLLGYGFHPCPVLPSAWPFQCKVTSSRGASGGACCESCSFYRDPDYSSHPLLWETEGPSGAIQISITLRDTHTHTKRRSSYPDTPLSLKPYRTPTVQEKE